MSLAPATTEVGEMLVRTGVGLSTVNVAELDEVPPPGAGFTTATAIVPALASWVAVSVAVSEVALTKVVALGVPAKVTSDAVTKPVPVTVTATGDEPAVALDGVIVVTVGLGLPTVKVAGRLTPPPGAGFVTTTGSAPVVVRAVAGIVAVRAVALVTVVGIAVPLNETLEAETKPVPTAEIVVAGEPTVAVLGVIEVTVTVGLATVNAIRVDGPPPGRGFETSIGTVPDAASDACGTTAVSCVLLTNVVGRTAVPKSAVEPDTKPVPVIVTDVAAAPMSAALGAIDVSVATGLLTENWSGLVVPPPGAEVETVIACSPLVARRVAGRVALRVDPVENDVASGLPSSSMTVRERKFCPAMTIVGAIPPTSALEGVSEATVGIGAAAPSGGRWMPASAEGAGVDEGGGLDVVVPSGPEGPRPSVSDCAGAVAHAVASARARTAMNLVGRLFIGCQPESKPSARGYAGGSARNLHRSDAAHGNSSREPGVAVWVSVGERGLRLVRAGIGGAPSFARHRHESERSEAPRVVRLSRRGGGHVLRRGGGGRPRVLMRSAPARNPPTWAHQATPPEAAATKEIVPESACCKNQNPRKRIAGTLKKNGMIDIGRTTLIVARGETTKYAPSTPAIAPEAPTIRDARERREPHLRLRRDDARGEVQAHEARMPDAALETASEHPQIEHVPENVRPAGVEEHRRKSRRHREKNAPGCYLARGDEAPRPHEVLLRARRKRPFTQEDSRRSRRPRGT